MKRLAASTCVCVVTLVVAGVAMAAGPALVLGHGAIDTARQETFTFAAVLDAMGKPRGRIDYVLDAGTPDALRIRAKVTCLRVIGTQAVVGGEIVFSSRPLNPPAIRGIILTVVDGAAAGAADRFGTVFTGVSHLTCPTTLGSRPITDGEIVVIAAD